MADVNEITSLKCIRNAWLEQTALWELLFLGKEGMGKSIKGIKKRSYRVFILNKDHLPHDSFVAQSNNSSVQYMSSYSTACFHFPSYVSSAFHCRSFYILFGKLLVLVTCF
jgi:hypothetical protein